MSQVRPDTAKAVPDRTKAEMSVPAHVYPYRFGALGGAIGGLAMVVIALVYGLLSGRGLWLPVNLIGATLVRDLQSASLETLMQFNLAALIVGLSLHIALSAGLGFVFALLLPTMPGPPIVWSLTVGPLLWVLASLLTLPLLNPIMAQYVDVMSFFIAHMVYGLVLGWYVTRQSKVPAK
ncbi:MAG TPA: hypothetical protein VIK33_07010 [Anaerolineae bacterium]